MLTKEEKRRYAKGVQRLQVGLMGYSHKIFYKLHLTTRLGDDNSVKRFTRDFRKLIRIIRTDHEIEYCGALGYTPKSGLLHGHFIIRVKQGFFKMYDGGLKPMTPVWFDDRDLKHSPHIDANRRAIGDLWNKIHGAFSVQYGDFSGEGDFIKYIVQHVMKDYSRSGADESRFLVSQGWRKKIPRALDAEYLNWLRESSGCIYLGRKEYATLKEFHKAVAKVGDVYVKNDGGFFVVKDRKVAYAEIYGGEYNAKQ